MRNTFLTTTMALLLLCGCAESMAVENHDREWEILIKYGDSMAGQGTAYSDESCAFVWHFSDERKGVTFLGDNPVVDMNEIFGDLTDDGGRRIIDLSTGSRSGNVSGARPDLIAVLTIKIDPQSKDELRVKMRLTRWQLLDEPPPYDYRFETEAHFEDIEVGDSYIFNAGTGPDGRDYPLEMIVNRVGSEERVIVGTESRIAPIVFHYEMRNRPGDEYPKFRFEHKLDLREGVDIEPIEIQVPVDIEGVDSSVINIDIKLKDIYIKDVGQSGPPEVHAVFHMDRMLVVNIESTSDTEGIFAERLVNSSYNHAVRLRHNKRIRIELPSIEDSKYPVNAREVIEIEPLLLIRRPR